jgi:hypothetical protein
MSSLLAKMICSEDAMFCEQFFAAELTYSGGAGAK